MRSGVPVRIYSTFVSVNGEVCEAHQGSMCTFVRFAGCNIRCSWCDTKYAQKANSGHLTDTEVLMEQIRVHGCKNITITGGEPFMQEDALDQLCVDLLREGYNVSVETNGTYKFEPLGGVNYVVDFKLPSSNEYDKMKVNSPWMSLRYNDWIKFVVADVPDYETACATMDMLDRKGCLAQYAISPIFSSVSGNRVMQWLRFDRRFNVVISVQLHKLLDLSEPD
ncbi:MAG: hypothetical protein AM326_01640 [Candidatus Thorarchaeota archaeon SMTZ-45]|nr:MAG: hypothetical protein AM326_01640 [Candidatus Thorarchaeota archaeon SMTZ-45]